LRKGSLQGKTGNKGRDWNDWWYFARNLYHQRTRINAILPPAMTVEDKINISAACCVLKRGFSVNIAHRGEQYLKGMEEEQKGAMRS
jgi:hypothetical protein